MFGEGVDIKRLSNMSALVLFTGMFRGRDLVGAVPAKRRLYFNGLARSLFILSLPKISVNQYSPINVEGRN